MNQFVIDPFLVKARRGGLAWAAVPLAERLAVIARTRIAIARRAPALAATIARPEADTIAAEILPLAAAARFLERNAPRLLRPRRLRLAPLWLFGVDQEIRREPRGAVLIIAPGNYPLFLPGVQTLQALAAGNAVCVKPAPGKTAPMQALADLLAESGLPEGALQLMPEDWGAQAASAGFDHIVLTGSAATGLAVSRAAAESLTPTTMELSGIDAVFVLPGADLALVAVSLAYGLRLNAGATCIAPRRVFIAREREADLLSRLLAQLPPPAAIPAPTAARLATLLAAAEQDGARIPARNPAILAGASPSMALLQEDLFAPWLALVPVADTESALAAAALCPYALGVSIFGPEREARALAARIRAGSVCINDLIVPTADPRLPFGGRGASGHGVTRGAEGLLEMTALKTVSIRRGRFRPHLEARFANDAAKLRTMLLLLHGTWDDRWQTLRSFAKPPGQTPEAPEPPRASLAALLAMTRKGAKYFRSGR
jgi:acyl-CoA reductase-like NAD-dependent aldehyde dehydrogenase